MRKEKKRLNPKNEKVTTSTETERPLLALSIATSLGVGYLPWAPGTWGSAAGIALVAGTAALTRSESGAMIVVSEFSLLLALAAIGLWASQLVGAALPTAPGPGHVVIEQRAAQTLASVAGLALSAWTAPPWHEAISAKSAATCQTGRLTWKCLLGRFLLFRLFEIWKPFRARRAEF